MRWLVAALLVSTLAGCAGEESGDSDESFSEELDENLQATATTGIIRGVVIDGTITPIEGATVALRGVERTTTTNADGAFGFSDLEPGTYFLEVSRFGYTSTQSSVEVVAGVEQPPIVKVQLERIAGLNPYSDTFVFDGFIQCSLAFTVNAIAACSVPGIVGVDLGDRFAVRYTELGTPPTHSQSEMLWESSQVLGQTLKLRYTDDHNGGLDNYRTDEGQSPRRVSVNDTVLAEKHFEERGLFARVFPSYNELPGVVLILQQDFEIYTSVFYHYTPPEEWWFINDNSRPAPPEV